MKKIEDYYGVIFVNIHNEDIEYFLFKGDENVCHIAENTDQDGQWISYKNAEVLHYFETGIWVVVGFGN
jgi:hypothetical protein